MKRLGGGRVRAYEGRPPDRTPGRHFTRAFCIDGRPSGSLAKKKGLDERVVMACLLHDIAMAGLITSDHGYWGAQLIDPYVDEEVSWAVRHHQALRYFPDESVGYLYPEAYILYFGEDYHPPDHLRQAYEQARRHK